ncbi:zf-HC2 domain-containing protein [Pendulispora rubella]|uniref:Zf-HC2 domain-containing protein n=1 Tax=Pendulispora rubella TaxID=2741070 RepID=A0ABZ2L0M3_9BACT
MSTTHCTHFSHLLGAYVDGELEPSRVLEVDEHVASCETCRERVQLDHAVRGSLKRIVKASAPEGLRSRVALAMAAERERGERRADAQAGFFSGRRASVPAGAVGHVAAARDTGMMWRAMVPLASAAALAVVWGVATRGPMSKSTTSDKLAAGLASDTLIQDLVAEHSHPLPPESTDPKAVNDLERYVGVPVRPTSFEKRTGARLVGGRVLPMMHHERAAMLTYEIGTGADLRRVSVFVYDPKHIQMDADELAPRAVGTAQVRVGNFNGFSLAVTQRAGVGYAIASNLDAERSAQLAAFADE